MERRDGDVRIEKIMGIRGKMDVEISARMWGQWFIESYVG